jgi:hypothetical protein
MTDAELWAIHVQGPDDIIAAADKASAEQRAKAINDWYAARTQEPDFDPRTYPRIHAAVIAWPYAGEAHAEALREQEEDQ